MHLLSATGKKVPAHPGHKRRRGLGDLIHRLALPIARWLKLRCYDRATRDLKPGSPCAKRQAAANTFGQKLAQRIRRAWHKLRTSNL